MLAEGFRKHKTVLIVIFGVFVLWGIGHRLYETLVPEFAQAFSLNSSQLVLTQSVYDLVYFVLAVPAAIYARTFGSKATIIFGLGSRSVGAFLFLSSGAAARVPVLPIRCGRDVVRLHLSRNRRQFRGRTAWSAADSHAAPQLCPCPSRSTGRFDGR